ncbi:MAG: hypothetical protein LBL31_00765 [Spirochaetaceae bacterium]|jgi:hypothetical protein|nr:hypothetical protein [Spirochaetaceae bacterium]
MKKLLLTAAAVIFLTLPTAINAQQTGTFQLISLDIGYAPAWQFETNDNVFPQLFALNIRVADGFTAGFQSYSEGSEKTANLFNMKYDFIPGKVRGIMAIGIDKQLFFSDPDDSNQTETVAGLGFEYAPFTRNVAGSVTTEFKIGVHYLFTKDDVASGAVVFNVAFSIGV